MNPGNDSIWLRDVVERRQGFETEAVDRFTQRLMLFAQKRMPQLLLRRVDPEDVVQSVFRSFFARHQQGQFRFADPDDVWRLLSAMTYRKLMRTIRHHSRQQRDLHRETTSGSNVRSTDPAFVDPEPSPSSVAVMMEFMDRMLDQLPETHREIFTLRLENYSIQEIADRLQVSMRTVNRTLKNIRELAYEMADAGDAK